MRSSIDVLLPTFNGEEFLSAQIESLLCQSYNDWRLIIRDDLSTDGTLSLINEYKEKYPERITVLDNQSLKKGVVGSFEALMNFSTAPYMAFCDQDDVWNHDKLLTQIDKMHELEISHGNSAPILLHSDLHVVNDRLDMLSESFWSYQNLNPDKMSCLPRLLAQNCVTGCTMLINRPLAELATPFPNSVIMHDWWLALVAASEGVVYKISMASVLYRQHNNNDTGAKRWGAGFIFKAVVKGRNSRILSLLKTCSQAEGLLQAGVLNAESKRTVEMYVSLENSNLFLRVYKILRCGFFKYGVIRNIAMLLRI